MEHLPGLVRYALAGLPLELRFYYSSELVQKLRCLASTVGFDIVQIEHSHMALYLEALPPDAYDRSILEFVDVAFGQCARISSIELGLGKKVRRWLYSRMMRRWEPRYAERFDRCTAVSEVDRRLLMTVNPRLQVDVVANGVDTKAYQPLARNGAPASLLFVGTMSYSACADAVLYFCSEVLPLIRQAIDNVEMWIVGTDPPPEVLQLNGNGVHVTGRVESVVPYYRRSTVCLVPLRAGGGTRLKILEAMALGRPVVSTTVGCEGLDVTDEVHLLVADSPEQFAEATLRLLGDRVLYQQMVSNARQLVVDRYDWDALAAQMIKIYGELYTSEE
jgi:glycosyltransferase involved in cell wall biosynthesis